MNKYKFNSVTLADKASGYKLFVVVLVFGSIDMMTVLQLSYQLMKHTDTPFSEHLLGKGEFSLKCYS